MSDFTLGGLTIALALVLALALLVSFLQSDQTASFTNCYKCNVALSPD